MTPNNDGQGAMALIMELEGKVRKYQKARNKWRNRTYQTMVVMSVPTVRFNLGALTGMGLMGFVWFIVSRSF